MIPIDRAIQNFPVPSGKDHFLYNSLYNRDVEFMKNLIRNNTGDPDRHPNFIHSEYDPRQEQDHHHDGQSPHSNNFIPKMEHPSPLDHQQFIYPCGNGPHMLPLSTRSFPCSQISSLVDYPCETIKQQQQHCKCEKHEEEGIVLKGKCQIHTTGSPVGSADIIVKTEVNDMQQSKSSPVHEVFEMTSNAFTSTVTGSDGPNNPSQFHLDHHDSGSPPMSHMETTNSSSIVPTAASHHLQHHQHQCSPHSYESYLYTSSSGGRVGMSTRQLPGSMNSTSSVSEISGAMFHNKSFFADSGSGSSGIAAFFQHHSNNDSCRDDSRGPSGRDSEEKVVLAIKASRKMQE